MQDPGDSRPYYYNLITAKEEADLDINQVKTIYEGAFEYIKFAGSFDTKNLTSIGSSAFRNSKFDGTFTVGEKLGIIFGYAFYNSEFTGRLDTGSIRLISDYAFENSTFDSIKLGKGLRSLGTTPFGNTENTSVGSEVKDGKLHSMVLPELEYLAAHSLTGLKIEGTLDIPKIIKIGYSNISPAGFASCNFNNIILPERLSEKKKQEFKDAVENDLFGLFLGKKD